MIDANHKNYVARGGEMPQRDYNNVMGHFYLHRRDPTQTKNAGIPGAMAEITENNSPITRFDLDATFMLAALRNKQPDQSAEWRLKEVERLIGRSTDPATIQTPQQPSI